MSKRDAYVKKLKVKLEKWNAEIHMLEEKAKGASAEMKEKYYTEIEKLRGQFDHLKEKLGNLQDVGEESWKELKNGIDASWKELKKGIKEAGSRFKR